MENDLKRLEERNNLRINTSRNKDAKEIIEAKLNLATSNLNAAISTYKDFSHPSILESLLNVSKLSYYLGRIKDSQHTIKRGLKKVQNFPDNDILKQKYIEWETFLNNS